MVIAPSIPVWRNKGIPFVFMSIVPTVLLLNYLLFGKRYFTEAETFFPATIVLLICCSMSHAAYVLVMRRIRERFPTERHATLRIGLSLGFFVVLSGILLLALFKIFQATHFLEFKVGNGQFSQCYAVIVVLNAFFTFVYEARYNLQHFVANSQATDELKKEYLQSQLLSLKSQMNPHFLFNSLNTLSSLIQEDPAEAELFLDNMSKVFRYLLRHQDDKEVSLKQELNFLSSYYRLLKARHADGLELQVHVPDSYHEISIPPLTLQMLLEHIVAQQTISRSQPLTISVAVENDDLIICHNWQPKQNADYNNKALENIRKKFTLLRSAQVVASRAEGVQRIVIPLTSSSVKAAL
jgi:two-component system, LytTR family, sensor kinase